MKNTKIFKILFTICAFFMGSMGIMAASAPSTVTVSSTKRTESYLVPGALGVNYRVASDGTILYCLDYEKEVPNNGMSFANGGALDAGLTYIITNGYPLKSITGNKEEDFYITQLAIWWYQGDFYGHKLSNVVKSVKNGGYANNPVSGYIRNLYNGAVSARNAGYANPTFGLSTNNTVLSLDNNGDYFISDLIVGTGTNTIGTYNVSLVNAPEGVSVTNKNGVKTNTITMGEGFYVRVPADKVVGKEISFTINASSTGIINKAYTFLANNSIYQNMTQSVLYSDTTNLSAQTKANLVSKVLKISKQDFSTKEELPGATLVLKNSRGAVIEKWVSTTNPHYIYNLADGKYTLTETIAPDGYELSDETITIEINNGEPTKKVVMYNNLKHVDIVPPEEVIPPEEEEEVPVIEEIIVKKTDSSATIFYIICGAVVSLGGIMVYKYRNVKR